MIARDTSEAAWAEVGRPPVGPRRRDRRRRPGRTGTQRIRRSGRNARATRRTPVQRLVGAIHAHWRSHPPVGRSRTRAGGAGTALVGSHREVADAIGAYAAPGIDEFVLSGYPHLEELLLVRRGASSPNCAWLACSTAAPAATPTTRGSRAPASGPLPATDTRRPDGVTGERNHRVHTYRGPSSPGTRPTRMSCAGRSRTSRPLAIVATLGPDGPIGLLVASFTSVSLTPPLASVNIGHSSTTLPQLRNQPHWGISILGQDQESVTERFRRPAHERFAGLGWSSTIDGAVHLHGAAAGFTTRLNRLIPAGDHSIAILRSPIISRRWRAPRWCSTAADCAASSPRGGVSGRWRCASRSRPTGNGGNSPRLARAASSGSGPGPTRCRRQDRPLRRRRIRRSRRLSRRFGSGRLAGLAWQRLGFRDVVRVPSSTPGHRPPWRACWPTSGR